MHEKHEFETLEVLPAKFDTTPMDLQQLVLTTLDKNGSIKDTADLYNDQRELSGTLRSLESRDMITFSQIDKDRWILTAEAESIIQHGSHEAILFEAVVKAMGNLKISEIEVRCCCLNDRALML